MKAKILLGLLAGALSMPATCVFAESQTQSVESPAVKNQLAGEAFLKNNKSKPGVKELPDGLQYKVLQMGDGKKPGPTDEVTVLYEGKLIDGTVFDKSDTNGVTFPLNQVIKGWTEALQLMPEGSKWEIYIPAQLAYGENGPPSIGPNQTLIFQVTLLHAKKSG